MQKPSLLKLRGFNDSLDTVEIENGSHVLGQGHRIRPQKIICDGDDVLLAVQGRNNLLQDLFYFFFLEQYHVQNNLMISSK